MEKLNIKLLSLATVFATVAITSSAVAGPFRMNSKAPVYQPQKRGYVFGYGGVDTGAGWDTTGAFDDPTGGGYYGEAPLFDLSNIPIDFDLNNGWTAGGGIGVFSGFLGGSRFELEGSYTSNDVGEVNYVNFKLPASFDLDTKAVMFNMLKEVPFGQCLTGYFGGGVGYAWTSMEGDIDTILYDDSDAGFAWQLIAGVDIPVTERLALFMQYRYLVLSDLEYTTNFGDFTFSTDDNPGSHAVLFGARVCF